MTPVSSDCIKASLGHAGTHGASSQNLQTIVTLTSGCKRTTLIRDLRGLKDFSFFNAHANSQMPQPVHLLGSAEMNCLETGAFSIFHISPMRSAFLIGTALPKPMHCLSMRPYLACFLWLVYLTCIHKRAGKLCRCFCMRSVLVSDVCTGRNVNLPSEANSASGTSGSLRNRMDRP